MVAHMNYASFKASSLPVVAAVASASEPTPVKVSRARKPKPKLEQVTVAPQFGRSVDRDALSNALKRLASIADSKSRLPILGHVAVRACDEGLMLCATDLTMSLTVRIPSLGGDTRLGMCVPAKAAHDVVRMLPESRVTIERTESGATLTSGRVQNRLVGIPDRDFPKIPDFADVAMSTVDSSVLVDLIRATLHSVSRDETRCNLNGGFFESNGTRVSLVTTDGHRLTKATRAASLAAIEGGRIVPAAALAELGKILTPGACDVGVRGPVIFVRQGGMEFSTKCIDATFPPYDQVIPKSFKANATVSREALLAAMKRSALMAADTRGVTLESCEGDAATELLITTAHPDMGALSERLEAVVHGAFRVGARPEYLIEAASKMTADAITLEFGGPLDPVLLRPSDDSERAVIAVIMPMRID